jgi:hypothetical protein
VTSKVSRWSRYFLLGFRYAWPRLRARRWKAKSTTVPWMVGRSVAQGAVRTRFFQRLAGCTVAVVVWRRTHRLDFGRRAQCPLGDNSNSREC